MSDTLLAAIIAGSIALTVAFVNSIVAELFRRRMDRMAFAASIAGELASYAPAWPLVIEKLRTTINAIEGGARNAVVFRPFEKPRDFVFERMVDKLGLLGPGLVEDIVYVYGNINAFRVGFATICAHFSDMSDTELKARCFDCLEALERVVQKCSCIVQSLKCVAGTSFRSLK